MSTSAYGPVTTSGTVVSYLPLTTAWSAPAECSSLFLDTNGHLYLNAPEYHNGVSGSPECVPPEVSVWWYQSLNPASPTETLLGGYDFACPEAYTTAFFFLVGSTSTIGCCPSLYTYGGTWWEHGNPNQCSSTIPAGTITYVQPYSGTMYSSTSLYVSTPTTITGVQVNGFKIETAPQTAPPMTTSTTVSNSAYVATPSTEATNTPSGLDTKEKIGIGVGVSFGTLTLMGLLAIWFLLRRRKRDLQNVNPPETFHEKTHAKPELDSAPAPVTRESIPGTSYAKPELESASAPVKETNLATNFYEIGPSPMSQPIAELDSTIPVNSLKANDLLTDADISEMERRALEEETSGAYAAAEETYQRVIKWRESHQGPAHPATLTSIYRLVLVLNMRNKTIQADELYRELIQRGQTLTNPPRPSWPLIGEDLMLQGKNNEAAEKMIRQELALNMRVLGPEHLLTIFSQGNLANVLRRQLKLEEAEKAYRLLLQMSDKVLGPVHAYSLQQINNLAVTLSMQNKKDEAREIYRQTLERTISKVGYDHPDTYPSLHNLKGELDEDEDLQIKMSTPRNKSLPEGQKYQATVTIVRMDK
uniref:Kinesin light chain n=1 Tax=Talaromyces marneffei PM1 TaxID=1077442 RepID=A0A093UZN3_TALMA